MDKQARLSADAGLSYKPRHPESYRNICEYLRICGRAHLLNDGEGVLGDDAAGEQQTRLSCAGVLRGCENESVLPSGGFADANNRCQQGSVQQSVRLERSNILFAPDGEILTLKCLISAFGVRIDETN